MALFNSSFLLDKRYVASLQKYLTIGKLQSSLFKTSRLPGFAREGGGGGEGGMLVGREGRGGFLIF